MKTRRLLLDAGNTRLKWAVVENDAWLEQGHLAYADLSRLTQVVRAGDACFIASVVKQDQAEQIGELLGAVGVIPHWLKTEAQFQDVKNNYANPRQLGVDRWMGLIAARKRSQHPTLVVSAGTAMTVDALSAEGVFLGGLIVPGFALMQASLREGTAGIADGAGTWQAFPRCTADAVQSGLVAALCGAIQQQHARLSEMAGVQAHCLMTGGGASVLLPHLSLTVEQVPALVLEGVELVSRESEAG
ncbi:MAG: type III pantothenate kinase [Thiobacillus sp.]|nr:type III pantothenate kinase [Thiobacillus sp.]